MTEGKFIWMDGKFVPWKKATIHVLTHSFHYGAAVYEGIRVYPAGIFRLDDHLDRFLSSMEAISMKSPFTKEQLKKVIIELVKKNGIKDGYIRPIAYYGYERLGIYWGGLPVKVAIAAMPWISYLPKEMKMKISKWRRLSPSCVKIHAKVSGYYVNSNYATQSVKGEADEALLLDFKGNIAEAACANIFFVKNGIIYTPKANYILPGITRDSVIKMAKSMGFRVVEKNIKPREIYGFDEAFTTGTATEVTSVVKINGRKIGNGKMGEVAGMLRESFSSLVQNGSKKFNKWFYKV